MFFIRFISRYFGLLLLISCLIGMFVPTLGAKTPQIVMISLAFIVFCSFFQISLSPGAITADFVLCVKFYLLRYVVIPVALYMIIKGFSDFYALVILLFYIYHNEIHQLIRKLKK